MKLAEKKKAGEILGRGGIANKIIELADSISNGTYKNAIIRAGKISVLVEACKFDEYWAEKALIGKYFQEGKL